MYFLKAGSISVLVAYFSLIIGTIFKYLSGIVDYFSSFRTIYIAGYKVLIFLYLFISIPFKMLFPEATEIELFKFNYLYIFEFIFLFLFYGTIGYVYMYLKRKYKLIFTLYIFLLVLWFAYSLFYSAVKAFAG